MKNPVFEIAPVELSLPPKLRLIALGEKPIFPGVITPLIFHAKKERALIEESLNSDGHLGFVLSRREDNENISKSENPGKADLHKTGTVAKIIKRINLPDGGVNIFISTIQRFVIKKVISESSTLSAAVEYIPSEFKDSKEIKAMARSILSELKQISEGNPLFTEEMRLNMINIDHPGKIADFTTSILNIAPNKQQDILDTIDIQKRMEKVLIFLKNEKELLRIQKKIQQQINEKIEKSQREYFLREQLKTIREELGIAPDGKSKEYMEFRKRFESLALENEVREQIEKELDKFGLMEASTSEYQVTRNYLDTILSLPWNASKKTSIDIVRAERILNADHYGLEDVKNRILEFLAVQKRKDNSQGSIILLVGPPGVGKTSLGRSLARSMNRKFFRFSVGGMRDEAEIKGHRRTYVGAMPGKIIQGLKYTQTKSLVFMIDEVDKLGMSYQGDPASALLEVLDLEQNSAFRDHYLDLPFDLSSIVFVLTANTTDGIPQPLLDRMEVINLSGYIAEEKIAIAQKYIIPKSLKKHAISRDNIKFPKKTLQFIAENYAREAGMRSFEKAIDKINRKLVKNIELQKYNEQLVLHPDMLKNYLGLARFRPDEAKTPSPGMVTGLAWTNFGGETLTIEVSSTSGSGQFKLTGQMGEVMQESANIAYTWVRSYIEKKPGSEKGEPNSTFDDKTIHIHIPAGATPKDGPSAGITMASALLSLLYNTKVRAGLAMTGELSLSGSVLPIGGLKEKLIAAKRSKIREVIFPSANAPDLEEIPEKVKKGLKFHPVDTMDDVLALLFSR